MSVTTTADLLVTDMREKIQAALESTNEAFCEICVKGNIWGAGEFSAEFKQKLANAQRVLNELKIEIG